MPQRNDFSEPVKRALAARVGNLCSNPDCRARTSGPHEDAAKSINLGVAAHITAAAPGGPRYDVTLTSAQRSSAENAIWLCQNCAKLIDSDPARFHVALLREWKEKAEEEARSAVGRTAIQPVPTTSAGIAFGSQPLVILGPHVVAEGQRIAACGNRWTLQLSRFLIGDESALCRFAEQIERLPLHERFVSVSDPDDARLLERTLSWRTDPDRGVREVEVTVADASARFPTAKMATIDHDLEEIQGVAAAIQELRYALGSPEGGLAVPEGMGTWIGEWIQVPAAALRLNDLVRLELVRHASVPRMHSLLGEEHVSLAFVERVVSVHVRLDDGDDERFPADVEVVFVGAGPWKGEIVVARQPADPEACEKELRELRGQASGV